MCSRLQLCIYNQTYWWQWFDYYMSPRPNIMHLLRWHCRSVLPIPWLWLPPSARRMAQIIIEIIIIITIIITEAGPWNSPQVKTCFFVWMVDQILLSWFLFTDLGLSFILMAAWILWDVLRNGLPGSPTPGGLQGPGRGRGRRARAKVAMSLLQRRLCTLRRALAAAGVQQRKEAENLLFVFGRNFWGFGCTFLEMMNWTASCWILPASHLINTSPCQTSTGFQSCLHVIFELVFVSFWCPRHIIFHSFTFPIPWEMCHCLFMT